MANNSQATARRLVRRPILEEKETDEGSTLIPDDTDDAINDGHYFELLD